MMIRIEALLDEKSRKYFLEIYFPADASKPFVTTFPRYASPTAAEQDALAILASTSSTADAETISSGKPHSAVAGRTFPKIQTGVEQ